MMFPAALLPSLLATEQSGQSPDAFRNPGAFVGKQVKVCGKLLGISNLAAKDDTGPGFALDGQADALRRHARDGDFHLCVEGEVQYIGCATGGQICLEWMYDFAIRVRRAVPA